MACTKCGATKSSTPADYIYVDGQVERNTASVVLPNVVKLWRVIESDGSLVWVDSRDKAEALRQADPRRIWESVRVAQP